MKMPRFNVLFPLALATLSATALTATCVAQAADPAGPANSNSSYMQSQPAPIERGPMTDPSPNRYRGGNGPTALLTGQTLATRGNTAMSMPAQGVYLRVGQNSAVQAVAIPGAAADNDRTELRVEQGIANVMVHHPASHSEILVDLPGGQTALLKDGFYTFDARTNTVRVLHGEADAYPGANSNAKPIKVKENHAVNFGGPQVKSVEFQPFQASADVVPFANGYASNGGYGYGGYPAYGYGNGPYGDGFAYGYGYPYWAYGYPYGFWGDPYWGYGYPIGIGLGFGYYGGFHGGYGGGFHGGGGFGGHGGHR